MEAHFKMKLRKGKKPVVKKKQKRKRILSGGPVKLSSRGKSMKTFIRKP